MKPILVVTHERSGTHLLINLINYKKNGQFKTIGFINNVHNKTLTIDDYKWQVYKDIISNSYDETLVCKSHHQVQFFENYLDFLFEKYHVIYVKRELKDVLVSYYKFLPFPKDKDFFPTFDEWVFSKPDEIGRKFLLPYNPDPHVIVEPENYIERWKIHYENWEKYRNNILMINYEDILLNFNETKNIIENYIKRKIGDKIPNIYDKNLPNFSPNKGIVGGYKDFINTETISKINNYFK